MINQISNSKGSTGKGLQNNSDFVNIGESVMFWHQDNVYIGTVKTYGSLGKQHCLIVIHEETEYAVTHIV